MYSDAEVFVWDVDALTQIRANPTDKNLLEASARLRRLLMDDGTPLIHKVAGPLGIKVAFDAFRESTGLKDFAAEIGDPVFLYQNPDVGITEEAVGRKASLDAMLATEVAYSRGSVIKVRDIIKYCSNVAGGVHRGKPRPKNNAEEIHETARSVLLNGLPYPVEILRNIVNVSLSGLMPIYSRLRA